MQVMKKKGGAPSDPVVDIEQLLVNHAWLEIFDPGCLQSRWRRRRYVMEVNWAYVEIRHHVTSFRPRNASSPPHPDGDGDTPTAASRDLCLFRTEFKNASREPQTFAFKTERTTTSRCEINLQRGYRIGSNVDVRVNIPVGLLLLIGLPSIIIPKNQCL